MASLSSLEEVVRALERSKNALRIKKLLLCACQKKWENDPEKLQQLDLHDLLKTLQQRAPTLDRLKFELLQVIKRINKKSAYFLLASQIVDKLAYLYPPDESHLTRIKAELKRNGKARRYPYDLFDLKWTVSRHTTLNRTKVLIFSALNYTFYYNTQDWAVLKGQDFDDLVRSLFYACTTPEDLEFRLYGAATCLENPNKNIKIANLLVQSMIPYYSYLQRYNNSDRELPESEDDSTEIQTSYRQPNIASEGTTFLGDDDDDEDDTCQISTPQETKLNLSKLAISEALKKEQQLESDATAIVEQKTNAVMALLEESIKEIELYLQDNLAHENKERELTLKYRILQNFVHEVQAKSSRYGHLLEDLERQEKQNKS
jgi:hypothetical protein